MLATRPIPPSPEILSNSTKSPTLKNLPPDRISVDVRDPITFGESGYTLSAIKSSPLIKSPSIFEI